jgi:transposase
LIGDDFALGAISCQDLAREIVDFLTARLAKVTILRMLEQRHVTRFLLKDGIEATEIPAPLNQVSGADAMKKTQVFQWVREIRAGREDLTHEARPGRPRQINLDTILAHKLQADPRTTVGEQALSPGVSVQTITMHLHQHLGMKCYHLRWILHLLDDSQKAESVHHARIMLEALNVHARMKYQYLIPGTSHG